MNAVNTVLFYFFFSFSNSVMVASVNSPEEFNGLLAWLNQLGLLKDWEVEMVNWRGNSVTLASLLLDLQIAMKGKGKAHIFRVNSANSAKNSAENLGNLLEKFDIKTEGDWSVLKEYAHAVYCDWYYNSTDQRVADQAFYAGQAYERMKQLEKNNPWLRS